MFGQKNRKEHSDDFSVFGKAMDHLNQLRLCFEKCRMARLSLNPGKCAFAVKRGILLGHIISEEGMLFKKLRH